MVRERKLYYKCQLFFLFIFFLDANCSLLNEAHYSNRILTSIAFGSCNKPHLPQPLWHPIASRNPDIWMWLGDVVYADVLKFPMYHLATPIEEHIRLLNEQKQKDGYQFLLRQLYDKKKNDVTNVMNKNQKHDDKSPVILGIWDDHDYGINNGDSTYKNRSESKIAFMDFLDEPLTSIRRNREGLYGSYTFGPPEKQVMIILLDNRYFKNEIDNFGRPGLLGSAQWLWLENILKGTNASLYLIASGIQMLPVWNPTGESWNDHPYDRIKLLKLISKYQPGHAILLSGDIHFATTQCVKVGLNPSVHIPEFTSSGMTHAYGGTGKSGFLPAPVRFVFSFAWPLLYQIYSYTYTYVNDYYLDLNFGLINIDWDQQLVTFELIDKDGVTQITSVFSFHDSLSSQINTLRCKQDNTFYNQFARFPPKIAIILFLLCVPLMIVWLLHRICLGCTKYIPHHLFTTHRIKGE